MDSDGNTETINESEDRLERLVDEAMLKATSGARGQSAVRPALEARGSHHFILLIALVGLIAIVAVLFNALLN